MGDASHLDAVNDIQRRGVTDGSKTADRHFDFVTGLSGCLRDLDAGGLSHQGVERVDGIAFFNVVRLDVEVGTGDQLLFLDTVTDDDHFFQQVGVFGHDDVEDSRHGGPLFCLETDAGEL